MVAEKKTRRPRAKKPKLCTHGFPSIPDPRGCATCWNKHPGFVKPKPRAHPPVDMSHVITCEKCFLPSQTGQPPLVRIAGDRRLAKYEHRICPSDKMAGAAPTRRQRRFLRQSLVGSLRRHLRKMVRIQRSRRERAGVLRIEAARLERKLAAEKEEKRARRKTRAAG